MAVLLDDLTDAVGRTVRVKLLEQAVSLEGVLLSPDRMVKEGYRGDDIFGIQTGHTLRPFQPPHVETLEVI